MLRSTVMVGIATALLGAASLFADQNILKNGSMEAGEGAGAIDPQVADGWTEFGNNVERSPTVNVVPVDGGYTLKSFGDTDNSASGAYQELTGVSAGQSVTASVQLYSPSFDKLGGSGQAGVVLEFLDLFGGTIGTPYSNYPFNASSAADTPVLATVTHTAPSGTVSVRITCRLFWTPGDVSGAVYWDGAQLTAASGPNLVYNGNFEIAGPSPGQSPVGIDDWTGFEDQEKSTVVAEHGVASLQLGTDASYAGLYQSMGTMNAGDRLYMVAYVLNPSSDPLTANSAVGIKLEFDAASETPPAAETLPFDSNSPTDTWTYVELSEVVPTDVTIARVVCIFVGDNSTTGSVHFDSAWAERSSVSGVNQLQNESFEDGPGGANGIDNWTEFSGSTSSAQKSCLEITPHDGTCSLRTAGTSVSGLYQEITVTPGETVTFGAYLNSPSFEALSGNGTAGLKIEWAFGTVPDDIDIGGSTNTLTASMDTDTWTPIYIDFTMPTGMSAQTRFVNILSRGSALSGKVFIDSCEAVLLNVFNGSDVDGDGVEDMHDFTWLQRTFTDDGGGPLPFNGIVFDTDTDNDVDWADWIEFESWFTGP